MSHYHYDINVQFNLIQCKTIFSYYVKPIKFPDWKNINVTKESKIVYIIGNFLFWSNLAQKLNKKYQYNRSFHTVSIL